MKICCIGDLCGDLLLPYGEVKRHLSGLQRGEIDYSEVIFQYGGTVGNTCAVLGKLGARPYFVTDLCGDRNGRFLAEEMQSLGVDLSWSLENPDKVNMICIAVIDETGERVMFPWLPPGSDYPEFTRENTSLVPRETMLVFSGGMVMNNDPESMDAVCTLTEELKACGSTVVFDLNVRAESYGMNRSRRESYARMIACTDILMGSGREEFAAVTGIKDPYEAAEFLCEGKRTVIARDGSKPVMIFSPEGKKSVPVEQVPVLHTLGAGDSFNGAFLFAYEKGCTIEESAWFASRIAAHVISFPGHFSMPGNVSELLESAHMKQNVRMRL